MRWLQCAAYPDSGLGEIGPHGDLLAGGHVRISIAAERVLQLLQLLGGEVRALSPLPLVLLIVLRLVGTGCHRLVVSGVWYVLCFDCGLVDTAIACEWTGEEEDEETTLVTAAQIAIKAANSFRLFALLYGNRVIWFAFDKCSNQPTRAQLPSSPATLSGYQPTHLSTIPWGVHAPVPVPLLIAMQPSNATHCPPGCPLPMAPS